MNEESTVDISKEKSRRGLLALMGAGGAAALATLLSRSNGAQAGHGGGVDPDALHLGVNNVAPAGSETRLQATVDNGPALGVVNDSPVPGPGAPGPIGIAGQSGSGPGVTGSSQSGDGVRGHSQSGTGVFGETLGGPFAFGVTGASSLPGEGGFGVGSSIGVIGQTGSGVGVAGFSNAVSPTPGSPLGSGTGVLGRSGSGPGVQGSTETGSAAILGVNNSDGGVAVRGLSQNPDAPPGDSPANGAGTGVQGVSGSGFGVMGESASGPGVIGLGGTAGVVGESNRGPGVHGLAGSEGNADVAGVLGEAVGCVEKGPCGPGMGIGVHGRSEAGIGVRGDSQSGPAFEGFSESGAGAFVSSLSGPGVDATSESGPGVLGWSPGGAGVIGIGSILRGEGTVPEVGPGVLGIAPGDAAAVQAVSGGLIGGDGQPVPDPDGGLALDVVGKARFSTAGAGTVPQGQNSVLVANAAVTADSHISITLASNPGSRQLHWVEGNPGVGFRVRLTQGQGPKPQTNFTYLIVEPAA